MVNESAKPAKADKLDALTTSIQTFSVTHSGAGFLADVLVSVGPANRKRHSCASISPRCCMIATHSRSENMSLCRSKSDRQMLL